MPLTTCAVRARVYKQDGTPDTEARVTAVLNRFDVNDGYVGPTEVCVATDENGEAILNLWPNELGSTESYYNVIIEGTDRSLQITATVPNTPTVDLEVIAVLPPYPGKPDGQAAVEEATAQAVIATEQAEIATVAAGTATTQAGIATAAAGTATTQAGIATTAAGTATTQAGIATTAAGTATTQAGIATAAATAAGEALDDIEGILQTTVSLGGPPNAESLRVVAPAPGADTHVEITGGVAGPPTIASAGTPTDINLRVEAKNNGVVTVRANGALALQMLNPTAGNSSYYTFSGRTTDGPVLQANGLTNTPANFSSRGNAEIRFHTHAYLDGTGIEQVRINPTAGATRYLAFTGSNGGNVNISTGGTGTDRGISYSAAGTAGHDMRSNGATAAFMSNPSANCVNYFWLRGSPTGVSPTFRATGTDTNVPMTFNVMGAADFAFTSDGDSFIRQFKVGRVASATRNLVVQGSNGGRCTIYTEGAGTDRGIAIAANGAEGIELISNAATAMYVANPASSVNYANVTGAVSGGFPSYSVAGPGADIGVSLSAKNNAPILFGTNNAIQARVGGPANAVNYFRMSGNITGSEVVAEAAGSDTNTKLRIKSQGSGGEIIFEAAGSERLRIDSAGKLVAVNNTYAVITELGHLRLRSYTVGTLPSATPPTQLIYVSDGTSNKRMAVSDGTNWRWPDGAVVS